MSDVAIEMHDLSKRYRLGERSTGSLRQDILHWWTRSVLRKESRFFEDRRDGKAPREIWALKDINFSIREGEVWGFVGSNGAGKSTLLKIISKIVKPTTGYIRGRGVISSLLEVGTGFHAELSGRENIYISGYLLGMRKDDIRRNFDAIVAFSGIADFVDTPVKRYSSGMYVRLAFAVAAYLEPDILIVDEVLAVGDAEFQKKCIGKMNEVAREKGRTILFVSHNMQAMKQLCHKAVWLESGRQKAIGDVDSIVNQYITTVQKNRLRQEWDASAAPGTEFIRIRSVELQPELPVPEAPLDVRSPLKIVVQLQNLAAGISTRLSVRLYSYSGECIFELISSPGPHPEGMLLASCTIPPNFLNDGSYFISLVLSHDNSTIAFSLDECISFDLADHREPGSWLGKWTGVVRPSLPLIVQPVFPTQTV
jgi:lipopolysaccharide transport system ATP-binding protein